jgi:hypothetical protein
MIAHASLFTLFKCLFILTSSLYVHSSHNYNNTVIYLHLRLGYYAWNQTACLFIINLNH